MKGFRELLREWHPDKNLENAEANQQFGREYYIQFFVLAVQTHSLPTVPGNARAGRHHSIPAVAENEAYVRVMNVFGHFFEPVFSSLVE